MIANKENITRPYEGIEAGNNNMIELLVDGSAYKLFLPNLTTDYIQHKISAEKSPYELQMLQDIRKRVLSNDLVLDVGANVGNHTLYLARVANCHVVAFEPNPALAEAIRTSAEINGLTDRVTVYALGIGKQSAVGYFSKELPDNLGAQSISLGEGPIQVVALDSIKFEYPVKVIKIDVEGMELAVLQGAESLLHKDRPILYVECRTEDEFRSIHAWLKQMQYCYWETFNVTPTHLFLPNEQISLERRLSQIQFRAALVEYKESQKLSTIKSELDKARQKYRTITEQMATLKSNLEESNHKYLETKERIDELKGNLDESNKRVDELKGNLDESNRKYREASQRIDSLKERLAAEREQNKILRKNIIAIRSGIAFQLGYALVSAARSWHGLIHLPASFWRIFKQVLRIVFKRPVKTGKLSLVQKHDIEHGHPQDQYQDQSIRMEPLSPPPKKSPLVKFTLPGTKAALKVACIMDEFTYNAIQPECNLSQLTPDHWQSELEAFQPELLFIESAWRGKDELWGGKVSHNGTELQGIVTWCRFRNVPTVFWNKEDPIHFQTFLNTAKLFDFVFTTDIDCIHRYKAALGHDRIFLLPFACQPIVNNPIELYQREEAVSFAGAYYVRYPERTRDLESFLNALPAFCPVKIYDRNYGKDDPNYQFPPEYRPYIVGTLPFDKIDLAYKGYKYAINLNSIKQSQTMFARRVYELLGSNTITISNYSRGLRLMLGELVITSDNGSQIVQRLRLLAENPEAAGKFKLAALRKVMSEHTYGQRMAYVLAKVGGKDTPDDDLPAITVLTKVESQADADAMAAQFHTQTHRRKCLVMVAPSTIELKTDTEIRHLCLEEAIDQAIGDVAGESDWIAGMSSRDYYGPNYLLDIAIATLYTKAAIIGKAAHFQGDGQNIQLAQVDYAYKTVEGLAARCAAVRKSLVGNEDLIQWIDSLAELQMENGEAFAIDPYNYCQNASFSQMEAIKARVNDLPSLDTGLNIHQLQKMAEQIPPATNNNNENMLGPERLAKLFGKCRSKKIKIEADENSLVLNSHLKDGRH